MASTRRHTRVQTVTLTTESYESGTLSRRLSGAWERELASVSRPASGWGECGGRGSGGGPGTRGPAAGDTGRLRGTRGGRIRHRRGRVKRLEAGESYVEDVSSCELATALNSGRFRLSSNADDCTGFDVAVITVPTPLRDGLPDLAYIEATGPNAGPLPAPGLDGDLGVHALPRNHPGAGAYLA